MAAPLRNVLFIMVDQLRWDYVGAYGRSPVPTPNIDRLARAGARFDGAFVQGPVCGPSRMSYYTGRYVISHGARWNRVPLSLAERTLGDYLAEAGIAASLAGKTHVLPDTHQLARLGIEIESERGALLREGGFRPVERFDGHSNPDRRSGYADFLRSHGLGGAQPWADYAVSVASPTGEVLSGWAMRNVHLPARVPEPWSETAYLTDRAIDFVRSAAQPWCLHLSYVKPHWPYVAPAPYHAMFRDAPQMPIVKADHERDAAHPVLQAFQGHEESRNFGQDAIAAHVKPAYMGLVAQLDAHLGRLLDALEASGQREQTLIVFCADHGDMLGDHWLGEKELFYEAALRTPLLVVDPRPQADASRGGAIGAMVEAIDVLPTILDAVGVPPDRHDHLLEGRSLLPLLQGQQPPAWRDAVFSEADYAYRQARWSLGRAPDACRGTMVRTRRWKYVEWQGFRPQLFDLQEDPDELHDLGGGHLSQVEREMRDRLLEWSLTRKNRTTASNAEVEKQTEAVKAHGIHIGVW